MPNLLTILTFLLCPLLMGGAMWAESEVGVGSSFHVRLPREGKARLAPYEAAQSDHS